MSCTGCGSGFGILKKEVGCDSCGFAFCSKCCSKRTFKKDDSVVKQVICNKCFSEAEDEKKPATYSPPLAHKKRMATLGSRSQSVAVEPTCSRWDDKRDREIAERLQKLKRETKRGATPSQEEIENRLAKLKGMDPAQYTAPPITVYRPGDRRSSTEQATDLVKQLKEEVQIDTRRDEEWSTVVAARLAKLRGEPSTEKPIEQPTFHDALHPPEEEEMDVEEESKTFKGQSDQLMKEAAAAVKSLESDKIYQGCLIKRKSKPEKDNPEKSDEEDDEEADRVLAKLLEVNLEDPDSLNDMQMTSPDSDEAISLKKEDSEEFPWCVICTEDAKIRCFGCDSDLYCMRCFNECHDSLDIKDHKTCAYLRPKV